MYNIKLYYDTGELITIPMAYKHVCVSYLLVGNFEPDLFNEDKYYNKSIGVTAYIVRK